MEKLPSTAQDWLTLALDPFHDMAVPVEGAPDATIGRSYTRVYTQTAAVSATTAGDNVACIFTGFHGRDVGAEIAGVTGLNFAPMFVVRSPSAVEPTFYNVALGTASLINFSATTTDSTIPSRLIAMALEIHDTSAAVNKQGSLVANHISGSDDMRSKHCLDSAAVEFTVPVKYKALMPGTLASLSNLPGSLIREAKDGCYIVARLKEIQPPARFGTNHHPFEYREFDGTTIRGATQDYTSNPMLTSLAAPGLADSGFQPFIVRLSGLNANSTFRVVWRTIVEFFPEVDSMTNCMVATPSVPFCSAAFKAYHDTMSVMPTFVPVSSNDAGDYWRMAKKAVAYIAPYALKAAGALSTPFFGPVGPMLTSAAGDLISRRRPTTPRGTVIRPKKKKVVKLVPKRRR